jgi:hypothetical protein
MIDLKYNLVKNNRKQKWTQWITLLHTLTTTKLVIAAPQKRLGLVATINPGRYGWDLFSNRSNKGGSINQIEGILEINLEHNFVGISTITINDCVNSMQYRFST